MDRQRDRQPDSQTDRDREKDRVILVRKRERERERERERDGGREEGRVSRGVDKFPAPDLVLMLTSLSAVVRTLRRRRRRTRRSERGDTSLCVTVTGGGLPGVAHTRSITCCVGFRFHVAPPGLAQLKKSLEINCPTARPGPVTQN